MKGITTLRKYTAGAIILSLVMGNALPVQAMDGHNYVLAKEGNNIAISTDAEGIKDTGNRGERGTENTGYTGTEGVGDANREDTRRAGKDSFLGIERAANTDSKGAGDTEPKGAGDTEPKGVGDTEPKGVGDTEPKGVGGIDPEGVGGIDPEGVGDTDPEDAGGTGSKSTGDTSLEYAKGPENSRPMDMVEGATPSDATEAENDKETDRKRLESIKVAAMLVTSSNARLERQISATGDLWNGWQGDTAFSGNGTKYEPFQIGTLAQLMGFSELVAAGIDFNGQYIELTQDIDLGNLDVRGGNWNPIGWYQNSDELKGTVKHPFRGHFDGGGNTITGLTIVNLSMQLQGLGLFGAVSGGSIQNLTVQAEQLRGQDRMGILAGSISQGTIIKNVTVSGDVYSLNHAGGIAGEIIGGDARAVVENCIADGVIVESGGMDGGVGGIAGRVERAYLVDNTVHTYDGNDNRIKGKCYIGGIAGIMNQTDIFNSYVTGTIGGNGSRAAGGIIGKYESGNLILARFDGDISRTNNGTSAQEGTFVGMRTENDHFTYGTGSKDNLAYLFTTSGATAKSVFGSNIDGDNAFTKEAHIGYWTDNEKMFKLVAGRTEIDPGDRYFYEELEAGIKHIATQKLNKEFTATGYFKGLNFKLDHFAPGNQGEPVRGYLVSIPRIDTKNANGTYDTDVAALVALPEGRNSFYRQIDKDHPTAVANGVAVTIATAPKNSESNRYQMVYDESEPGQVKPPTYLDENGDLCPAAYQSGGTYAFLMPECDTEIKVQYRKVTTMLAMAPDETKIAVVHTRNGDRKNPSSVTEVMNAQGNLIARYINGVPDQRVEVQPVLVHAEHNMAGSVADKTVAWSVDDTDLLSNLSDAGYTLADARIMPNLESSFIQTILNDAVLAQANGAYKNRIADTVYSKHAVLTAASNPATSVDYREVYGNAKVTVTFQIIDRTTLRVEGLSLNKSRINYTVTRKLTGDRKHPTESITATEPVILTATLSPAGASLRDVAWSGRESGKLIQLIPSDHQDCMVKLQYDPDGAQNPAWIQNVINADNAARAQDPYQTIAGTADCREVVTAVSEDQANGHVMAECEVAIHFVTIDETVIYPEAITLSHETIAFNLNLEKTGKRSNPIFAWTGHTPVNLQAALSPALADEGRYKPYRNGINWEVANDTVTVSGGTIAPNLNSKRIREIISKYPYKGSVANPITVKTVDGGKTAVCNVTLNIKVIDRTYTSGGSGGGGSSGSGDSQATAVSGTKHVEGAPAGAVTGDWIPASDGKWTFISGGRPYAAEWAYIHNPYESEGLSPTGWFRFSAAGHMITGWYTDRDGSVYYLNPQPGSVQGMMQTGWHWIDANGDGKKECYYFAEDGRLLTNAVTPDGYEVNADGVWIRNRAIQTR